MDRHGLFYTSKLQDMCTACASSDGCGRSKPETGPASDPYIPCLPAWVLVLAWSVHSAAGRKGRWGSGLALRIGGWSTWIGRSPSVLGAERLDLSDKPDAFFALAD